MGCEFSRIIRRIRLTSLYHSMLTRVTPSASTRLNHTGKKRSTTAILVSRWREGWATVNSPAPASAIGSTSWSARYSPLPPGLRVAFHLFHQLCRDHLGADALFTDDKKAFGDIFTFDFKRNGITRPPVTRQVMNILLMQEKLPASVAISRSATWRGTPANSTSPRICTMFPRSPSCKVLNNATGETSVATPASGRIKTVA